jgi:hypothetical protein
MAEKKFPGFGFFAHLEEDLLRPETRRSEELLGYTLADDFIEFGASGNVWDKAETIAGLIKEQPADRRILDFKARQFGDNVVHVTYRIVRRGPGEGEEVHTLRSSLWRELDGGWQMVFHQGTPMPSASKPAEAKPPDTMRMSALLDGEDGIGRIWTSAERPRLSLLHYARKNGDNTRAWRVDGEAVASLAAAEELLRTPPVLGAAEKEMLARIGGDWIARAEVAGDAMGILPDTPDARRSDALDGLTRKGCIEWDMGRVRRRG